MLGFYNTKVAYLAAEAFAGAEAVTVAEAAAGAGAAAGAEAVVVTVVEEEVTVAEASLEDPSLFEQETNAKPANNTTNNFFILYLSKNKPLTINR